MVPPPRPDPPGGGPVDPTSRRDLEREVDALVRAPRVRPQLRAPHARRGRAPRPPGAPRRQGAHPPAARRDARRRTNERHVGRRVDRPRRRRPGRALESLDGDGRDAATSPLEDLVVVAEFRDPIYPGLVSTGKVERGGDKPFHTVINAENFHALQTLLFTHRGKVDCDLHRPAVQHGRAATGSTTTTTSRATTCTATRSGWRSWSGGCCSRRSCSTRTTRSSSSRSTRRSTCGSGCCWSRRFRRHSIQMVIVSDQPARGSRELRRSRGSTSTSSSCQLRAMLVVEAVAR